jgi:hypothetical protein
MSILSHSEPRYLLFEALIKDLFGLSISVRDHVDLDLHDGGPV